MKTREALSVQVEKDFPVPVEQLYHAWVTPDALKQWWRPMDNYLKEVDNDVREGGSFRYVFQNRNNDHSFEITGHYHEVKKEERLVYSWNWNVSDEAVTDSHFTLTITFINRGNNSRLEVVQENFSDEESVQPHREGWEKALDDLNQFVSTSAV
ncbi:MAG: SRPBCC domain-containing protein [Flavisolibacter sp.]|nr:SRPBCC domain-containing protein [Flavisolibacter sp.]